MAIFALTKAFQSNQPPIGSVVIHDEQLEWITKALFEQSVEFAWAINRRSTDELMLMEVSIVPSGMRLKHRSPGIVVLQGGDND